MQGFFLQSDSVGIVVYFHLFYLVFIWLNLQMTLGEVDLSLSDSSNCICMHIHIRMYVCLFYLYIYMLVFINELISFLLSIRFCIDAYIHIPFSYLNRKASNANKKRKNSMIHITIELWTVFIRSIRSYLSIIINDIRY